MMHLLGPLSAILGLEVEVLIERLRRSAVLYLTMALFGLVGFIFLLVAAYTALAEEVGPIWAPLIIAGVSLVLMLVVYVIAHLTGSGRRKREVDKRRSSETTALMTTAALTTLPLLLKSGAVRKVGLPLVALGAFALFGRAVAREHQDPPLDD